MMRRTLNILLAVFAICQYWVLRANAQDQVPLSYFYDPPSIFRCNKIDTTPAPQYQCVPTPPGFNLFPPPQQCDWVYPPKSYQYNCWWEKTGLADDQIQFWTECCSDPGTVGIVLQVAYTLGWKGLNVDDQWLELDVGSGTPPMTPEKRVGPMTLNVDNLAGRWLVFWKPKFLGFHTHMYKVDLSEFSPYIGRIAVFRWYNDWFGSKLEPDPEYATPWGSPLDWSLLEEANGNLWGVFGQAKLPAPDRATLTRLYPNGRILRVSNGAPSSFLKDAPDNGTILQEENGRTSVIFGGAKFIFPDTATQNRLFWGTYAFPVWNNALARLSQIPISGTLLREENGKISVIFGGAKFHVPDPATFSRLFSGWSMFQVWDNALAEIPDVPVDGSLLREDNGAIWIFCGQAKFRVPDPPTLSRLYFNKPIFQVWDGAVATFGSIPVDGTFLREESDPRVYRIDNGRKTRPRLVRRDADKMCVLWDGALANIP
jgi:hypothetical protein